MVPLIDVDHLTTQRAHLLARRSHNGGTGRGFRPSRHGGVAEMRSGALSDNVPRGPRVVSYPHPAHGGYCLTIAAIRYQVTIKILLATTIAIVKRPRNATRTARGTSTTVYNVAINASAATLTAPTAKPAKVTVTRSAPATRARSVVAVAITRSTRVVVAGRCE